MPEHTPGYVAALAAALHHANVDALVAAENGDNQLGMAATKHPGLRIWSGNLLRVGHHPLTPFAVECNAVLTDDRYVDKASHEHVCLAPPPPGYGDLPQWRFCTADTDGAVPITVAAVWERDPDNPEPR